MSESVGQALAIILPIGALVLSLHFFQWRQNVAMENRLRRDRIDSEERLGGEIKAVEGEIKAVEERLTVEIRAVEERLDEKIDSVEKRLNEKIDSVEERLNEKIDSVEKRLDEKMDSVEERLTNRHDRTDDKVDVLIGEVGLVKGAVIGISVETASRESVPTT